MKKFILLLSFGIFSLISLAQEPADGKFTHRLGLNFGGVTGLGPSYRYWPGKLGVQITFLPVKVEEEWQDPLHIKDFYESYFGLYESTTFISAGLSCMYTVKQNPKYRLVTYLGNHFIVSEESQIYNLGGGFGITFDYRVGFSLLLGYAGYDITGDPVTFPTAEIGVHVGISKK